MTTTQTPTQTARPTELTPKQLHFTPQKAVRWLAPSELRSAAVKAVVSGLFGSYADKRELQATLDDPFLRCHPDSDELWFDFVADLGDGFDPTYTVAWLLAQETLQPDGLPLPRGSLVVMGGDQVYPTASTAEYENRATGPYRAAFPQPPEDGDAPMLVALPGNHDWYDGLTAFLRVFCQRRAIGGWRTEQPRSYFAVRLPQRWWLLGVDIQLGGYVDDPQLRFFTERVRPLLRDGDGVIVATGKPSWIRTGDDPDAFNQLAFLEREVVAGTGAQVRLWVSGDKHHYVRYAELGPDGQQLDGGRQLVTCGLGGAYLSATHDLPPRLEAPSPSSTMTNPPPTVTYSYAPQDQNTPPSTYPDLDTSRRYGRRVLGIPWRNSGLVGLAVGIQLALVTALVGGLALMERQLPFDALRTAGVGDVITLAGRVLIGVAVVAGLVAVGLLARVARSSRSEHSAEVARQRKDPFALSASLLVAAEVAVALVALALLATLPPPWMPSFLPGMAFLVLAGGLAGVAGVELFAGWLYLFGNGWHLVRLRGNAKYLDWILAGQGIEDHKGFLRIHIGRDGNLTVYPVVVDRICRSWRADPEAAPSAPWVRPDGGDPKPRLAEPPFDVTREGA